MNSFEQIVIDFENIIKEKLKTIKHNYIYYFLENEDRLLEIASFIKKRAGRTVTISVVNKGEEYNLNYIFCIDEQIIINIKTQIKEERTKSISSMLKCSTFFQDEISNKYKIKFIEDNNIKIIEKRVGDFELVTQSLDDIANFKFETENEIIKNVQIEVSKSISMPLKNLNYLNRFYAYTTNNNSLIYALAIEDIAKIETSKKVKLIRMIADELIRASSHLFNFSLLSHYLNNDELMKKALKIRELLQDVKELLWSNRVDISINIIGGVNFDIDEFKRDKVLEKIDRFKKEFTNFYKIVKNDETLNKVSGFGKITKENILDYSLIGPIARASFINNDVRAKNPYLLYDELGFEASLRKDGDVYSRAFVRLDEVFESIRLIKISLEILPNKSIEKIKRVDVPKGESTIRIEAARGELFYYLRSEGKNRISRIITRTPTTMNWQMLKKIMPNNHINQMPLLLNSIDPCVACSLEI